MNLKTIAVAAASCALLSSCYCNKFAVGNINPDEELVHVKSVRHNHFINGAVVLHDNVNNYMQGIDNYVIESKQTFGDILVGGITLGIYTPSTTKFYVPKSNPRVVVEKQKKWSKAYKGYLK